MLSTLYGRVYDTTKKHNSYRLCHFTLKQPFSWSHFIKTMLFEIYYPIDMREFQGIPGIVNIL